MYEREIQATERVRFLIERHMMQMPLAERGEWAQAQHTLLQIRLALTEADLDLDAFRRVADFLNRRPRSTEVAVPAPRPMWDPPPMAPWRNAFEVALMLQWASDPAVIRRWAVHPTSIEILRQPDRLRAAFGRLRENNRDDASAVKFFAASDAFLADLVEAQPYFDLALAFDVWGTYPPDQVTERCEAIAPAIRSLPDGLDVQAFIMDCVTAWNQTRSPNITPRVDPKAVTEFLREYVLLRSPGEGA